MISDEAQGLILEGDASHLIYLFSPVRVCDEAPEWPSPSVSFWASVDFFQEFPDIYFGVL